VSGAQTPLPLIHPTDSISGGAERGGKSKPGRWWLDGLRACDATRIHCNVFVMARYTI